MTHNQSGSTNRRKKMDKGRNHSKRLRPLASTFLSPSLPVPGNRLPARRTAKFEGEYLHPSFYLIVLQVPLLLGRHIKSYSIFPVSIPIPASPTNGARRFVTPCLEDSYQVAAVESVVQIGISKVCVHSVGNPGGTIASVHDSVAVKIESGIVIPAANLFG